MIQVRKSQDRGHADHGWLDSRHTFSFADYHDPKHMGFSVLRVINEDLIDGGTGFGMHGHRDMEIISYMVEGALEHKDSMGNSAVILPGEVQRMSAGTGVRHSEYNHFKDKKAHLIQIWILPEKEGITPGYEQKSFAKDFASSDLVLVASRDGRKGSVSLNQDVDFYAAKANAGGEKTINLRKQRSLWVQVIKGEVGVDGTTLTPGDAAGIMAVEAIQLSWDKNSEFLLFDLP
jgi:redox-sensitive bicupin YhaK (pirin superfamily)